MALLAAFRTAAISVPYSTGISRSTVIGGLAWPAPHAVTAPLSTPSAGGSRVNGRASST